MKIKSVKLLKDLPGIKAGYIASGNTDKYSFGKTYLIDEIRCNPDFFEITYEEDETVHILLDVEVRKDYMERINVDICKFIKAYYNQSSVSDNPIISVKEMEIKNYD